MPEDLKQRLERARERERRARSAVARLRRALDGENKRLQNQRKYTLGAAVLAWHETGEMPIEEFRSFLARYVSRDADRAALAGTPFDVSSLSNSGESR